MATVIDTVYSEIEQVRDKLEKYFESTNQLAGLIKKNAGEIQQISRYLWRIPFQLYRGGHFHKYVADQGDMGAGTGPKIAALEAGYFDSLRSVRITQEQIDTSSSKTQATYNVFSRSLAEVMEEAQIDDDIAAHGDGTGKLTNAASTGTSTSLTFAATSDTLGINRLREGLAVDVWDSTGATKRAGGPYTISAIDYGNKIVTFATAVTGIATTDLIAFSGMDAYGPSTLTSFSSTWPGGGLTNGPGLTGDSFRHGIQYANDSTTSNYYLGKQKSAVPQLVPTNVNAANSALVFQHGQIMRDGIMQRRDPEVVNGLIGLFHFCQRAQVQNIGTTISNWLRKGGEEMIDVQPGSPDYGESFEYVGMKCYVDKRQDKARVDFINPKVWGRAQKHDTKFYEVGGRTIFEVRSASTGNMISAIEFHVKQAYDFVCFDPGAQGFVSAIAVPAGY